MAVVVLLAGCGSTSRPNLADQRAEVELDSRLDEALVQFAQAQGQRAALHQDRLAATRHLSLTSTPPGPTQSVTAVVTRGSVPVAGVRVSFTVHGANEGASGTCVPHDCRSDADGLVTFTYAVTHAGSDSIDIKCEPTTTVTVVQQPPVTVPPTSPPPVEPPSTLPPGPPRIFQVELRNCRNLHVGYDGFPAGARVRWSVMQQGVDVASGQFVAAGDDGYHFLTQPLGVRLAGGVDGAAHFTWVVGGARFDNTAARAPGC